MKRAKVLRRLGVGLLSGIALASFCAACKDENEPPKPIEFTFNETLVANYDEPYDPKIAVGEDVSIVSVTLVDQNGVPVVLDETYKFIPQSIGSYYYKIVLLYNGTEVEYSKEILVNDLIAPTVLKGVEDKTAELGIYTNFEADVSEIEVTDNNANMIGQISKRVTKIAKGNSTQTRESGFDEYLFGELGEYTITVEVKDISGNASYTEYKINAVDTTKPVVVVHSLNYAWTDGNGQITLPVASVQDISSCTIDTRVLKGETSLPITNGKINASVGDELAVTYTVTDASQNQTVKSVLVKVLEKGKLIDSTDDNLHELFSAGQGIIESDDGISFINETASDTLFWKDGAYTFDSVKEFAGLAFEITNRKYFDVECLLTAKNGKTTKCVGSFIVPAKAETETKQTFVIDLTKSGLESVDGWELAFNSNGALNLNINDIYFTSFAEPYITVDAIEEYKKGENLAYTVHQNGNEIYETKVTVTKDSHTLATLQEGEEYTFANAGAYTVNFAFDLGNKIYTAQKNITVKNEGYSVTLGGQFTGGKVGEEYTVPVTADSALRVSVIAPSGAAVAMSGNKFTPDEAGVYIVKYLVSDAETVSYTLYVESASEINFERDSAFNYTTVYNGGFEAVKDRNYASEGTTSAKATIPAGERVGGTFAQSLAINGEANYVSFNAYANLSGTIKLGIVVATKHPITQVVSETVYESGMISVNKGANELGFVLGASAATLLKNFNVSEIYVKNTSEYDNIIYLDNVRFSNKTTVTESEIFRTDIASVYGETNQEIIIPQLIKCDTKLFNEIKVTLETDAGGVLLNATQLEKINLAGYTPNTYIIRYKATTISNATYEKEIPLILSKELVTGELSLGDYFVSEEIELPAPILQSDVYDETTISEAKVNKYYRISTGSEWIDANGVLSFNATDYVDVKYTVEVAGATKLVLYGQTYIHEAGVHIDFEKWSGGDYFGVPDTTPEDGVRATFSEDWAYDGKYSVKNLDYRNNTAGKIVYANGFDFGFEANAMVFWAYAPADGIKEMWFQFTARENGVTNTYQTYFTLKKGVNKFVLQNIYKYDRNIKEFDRTKPCTISSCREIAWEIPKNQLWYFDNISFVNLGNVEYPAIDGKDFTVDTGLTLAKPRLTNMSMVAFTQQDIEKATYTVSYKLDGLPVTRMFAKDEQEINLMLPRGTYDITITCKVASSVFTKTQTVCVRGFECEFIEPRSGLTVGETYEMALPTSPDESVTMNAYYRKQGATEWTAFTCENGYASVSIAEIGMYEIKLTATKGAITEENVYEIFVRDSNTISDFELENNGSHFGGEIAEAFINNAQISDEWSYDGRYSLKISSGGSNTLAMLNYRDAEDPTKPKPLDGSYNAIMVWISAEKEIPDRWVGIGDGSGTKYYSSACGYVTLKPGVHLYTFVFPQSVSSLATLEFNTKASSPFYVDQIKLCQISVEEITIPEKAVSGTPFQIELPEATVMGEAKPVTIAYKEANAEEYTTVSAENGVCTVTPVQGGELSVQIQIEIFDGVFATYCEYKIEVSILPADNYAEDIEWGTLPTA